MAANNKPSMLVIDDDAVLCGVLARGFAARGFEARVARTYDEAVRSIDDEPPQYAVVDLRLPGGKGLDLVPALKTANPDTRIVVLTGYGSLPSAVDAIKLGATYYLAKPARIDDILNAFEHEAGYTDASISARPMSLRRLEWEHINRVLREHEGNVAATARALSMHRRTLQRKLAKRPVTR